MKIGFLSHLDLNLYLFRLPIMIRLIQEGHEVFAICPRGEKFALFKVHGIQAVSYQMERGSLNPFKELKALYNIYAVIKPLKLDMIHTFTAKPNIYGTIAAKMAGVGVIMNLVEGLGSFYVEDHLKNRFMRFVIERLYSIVFSFSDQVVFVNSDDPEYLQQQKVIVPEKITIIKSVGIDTNTFNMEKIDKEKLVLLRRTLGLEDKIVVLMVSRAIWHKGVKEYYEAASLLSYNKEVQCILVGDIDEGNPSSVDRVYLQKGHVMWLGHRDDIVDLTAMSDIYVLPSYREGIPRTLLEATSMGKAIVTTDTVGCREVVEDGYNGYLVPVQNSAQLAQKIKYLVLHPDKREVMGKNGRMIAVKEFDIGQVVLQYMKLYQEFMGTIKG